MNIILPLAIIAISTIGYFVFIKKSDKKSPPPSVTPTPSVTPIPTAPFTGSVDSDCYFYTLHVGHGSDANYDVIAGGTMCNGSTLYLNLPSVGQGTTQGIYCLRSGTQYISNGSWEIGSKCS